MYNFFAIAQICFTFDAVKQLMVYSKRYNLPSSAITTAVSTIITTTTTTLG